MNDLPASLGLICGGFFFLITFVIGLVLLLNSTRSKKKAGASQQWPGVPGSIVVSEVRQSSSTDDDGHTSYSYYPHVEYSYAVLGQQYSGKQVSFGGVVGTGNPKNAQVMIAKYPLNSPITVYYNPQNPAEAVLERAAGAGAKTSKTIGIILLVLSALIACPLLIGLFRNFGN
jgi:hypothetical protein